MVWSTRHRQVAPQTVQELSDALVQIWEEIPQDRAVQLIEFDSHAHLVSKAGSVIGTKSSSPVFKLSGS